MAQEYNRNAIRSAAAQALHYAGYRNTAYNLVVTDQTGNKIIIPLAVLDKARSRIILAIRVRKPSAKKTPNISPKNSKRSANISTIAGCPVVVIRSMSDAALLPDVLSKFLAAK